MIFSVLYPVLAAVQVAQNVFFGIIAVVMVFSALRVVTTKNIVHAALYLVVVLAGVAAQFILLGAEFAGTTQVLVYIGAVVVLFLFGIMLTRAKLGNEEHTDHDNKIPAVLTAVLLLAVMGYATLDFAVLEPEQALQFEVEKTTAAEAIEQAQLQFDADTIQYEADLLSHPARAAEWFNDRAAFVAAGNLESDFGEPAPPSPVPPTEPGSQLGAGQIYLPETSTLLVSDQIFSQYIVAFEAVSVLLLAALIGAIVIARKE